MKRTMTAFLCFPMVLSLLAVSAQAQDEGAKPAPVEAFFCNMVPGKDMKDLMKVAQRFSEWANSNDSKYSAWILTPQFAQLAEAPQVIWLGSYPSGDEMGKGLKTWLKDGKSLQQAFDEVVQCGAHSVATSVEINAPDGPPGDGVVMFTECSIAEGSDWMKAIDAHKKYSAEMRALGAKNSNWVFFPMIGGPSERNFDYWAVSTFDGWTDYFDAFEIYVNGGGWKKGMEAMKGVASCESGSPSVWDVQLVRSVAS
jgi:hypothetical protein